MAEPNTVHIWVVLYLAPERGSGHDSGAIYYFHIRRNPYYFTQIQFSSCAKIKRRSHWGLFFFNNPTPCRKFSSAYRIPRYPIAPWLILYTRRYKNYIHTVNVISSSEKAVNNSTRHSFNLKRKKILSKQRRQTPRSRHVASHILHYYLFYYKCW